MRWITTLLATMTVTMTASAESGSETRAHVHPVGLYGVAGVVVPENADAGLVLGAAVDMGSIWQPWLRLTAGGTRWSSDIDRAQYGEGVAGSVADTRLYGTLGVELFEVYTVRPYVNGGLALHFINADAPEDPGLAAALEGANFGAELAFGAVSRIRSLRLSAEARREMVNDAKNWSFTIGVGTQWSPASP